MAEGDGGSVSLGVLPRDAAVMGAEVSGRRVDRMLRSALQIHVRSQQIFLWMLEMPSCPWGLASVAESEGFLSQIGIALKGHFQNSLQRWLKFLLRQHCSSGFPSRLPKGAPPPPIQPPAASVSDWASWYPAHCSGQRQEKFQANQTKDHGQSSSPLFNILTMMQTGIHRLC